MVSQAELVGRFSVWDYVVFCCMLAFSAVIGIYYACSGGKQKTTREFLMADRSMGALPVSLSLLASFMSAITLLGTPAEIYNFSTIYVLVAIGYCATILVASLFYLPVFYKLEVTSSYEYLERRFNKIIRKFGSGVFITQMTMYMAIVLYAPALALSQVTGLHVWGSVVAIGVVCTFYTTLGGMKAVMWTDAFQIFIMFGSMLMVVIKGCIDAGGLEAVWQRNLDGERIQFNDFNPDPTVRHSFWSLTIGGFFTWLAVYGVNQAQVQRYLTTSSMRTAQIALWGNLPGLVFLLSICSFAGLVIYANYWNCDPLKSGQIQLTDQLLPLFVMDTLGLFPGLPGLFVAGIFSGALSTISSGMNSLAAVTLEDFVRDCMPNMSEARATIISKLLAFFYGALCIALVAVAERLGNVLQAALSIFGIVGGPLLGVFTLGMFFPCANSWGAGLGLIAGFTLSFWIGIGAQIYKSQIYLAKAPVSIAGCGNLSMLAFSDRSNVTSDFFTTNTPFSAGNGTFAEPLPASIALNATNPNPEDDGVWAVYKISYLWYSFIACWTVVLVGLVVSCLTGRHKGELDPRLISPFVDKICCCLPETTKAKLRHKEEKESGPAETLTNGWSMQQKVGADNPAFDSGSVKPPDYNHEEYTTAL